MGALRVCAAEFRRIASDPGALLILVGAVVLYAFFYPLPYVPEVLKEVPTVVVDLDGTSLSRRLARMADAHELIRVVGRSPDLVDAENAVRRGTAGGILEIPAGFERSVLRGDSATVGLYADAGYFLVYRQVTTGLLEVTRTLSAGIEIRRLEASGMPSAQALVARDPLPVVDRPLFNPAEGYASYIVPSILVLILQQTLLIGIGLLAGTAREQDAAPQAAGPLTVVLGRTLAYLVLYFAHAVFYFVVVYRVFGFPNRGDTATALVFALPFLLAAILLALAVSTVFRHRETALQVLLFTSLPAVFLAGFSWPKEMIPTWLNSISLLLPSTPAIAGFLRINQMGASLPDVAFEWRILWCLVGLYFALAWWAQVRSTRRFSVEARSVFTNHGSMR